MQQDQEERRVPKKAVCMAVHRSLLLAPLMGLENRLGRHCVQVMHIPSMLQVPDHQERMFTWKPYNSLFVTLIKHTETSTAIYLHDSDMHFTATEAASLGPGCPVNTVLLGQVVLDAEAQQSFRVMILLFDALQIGSHDFVALKMSAGDRYRNLRALCDNNPDVIVSHSTMMVQWAGPSMNVVKDFSMGQEAHKNLPNHVAEAIICFGDDHPCKLFTLVS